MVTMRSRLAPAGPIGFMAGDVNLYRFVGNDPTNMVDPSGLEERPPLGGKKGDIPIDGGNTYFFEAPTKADILKGIPLMKQKDCKAIPKGVHSYGVMGDDWWVGQIGENKVVGPKGCGSCVGMIIYPEKLGGGDVYVLHLSSKGKLVDGLRSCGYMNHDAKANVDIIQMGYHAVLCGSQQ